MLGRIECEGRHTVLISLLHKIELASSRSPHPIKTTKTKTTLMFRRSPKSEYQSVKAAVLPQVLRLLLQSLHKINPLPKSTKLTIKICIYAPIVTHSNYSDDWNIRRKKIAN
jgi:hypothetical protein